MTKRIRTSLAPLIACLTGLAAAVSLGSPDAHAASDLKVLPAKAHPYLACTSEELARLRRAWRGDGAEHDVVAAYVKEAARFAEEPVSFPPRGGQHNQWYQCDKCEISLKTIDPTHHQCPKCNKVYSGHPYDDVIFSRVHSSNLRNMETAAWAWAVSGEERFARYAAGVLLGYAQRYRDYPYHSASLEAESSWGRKAGGHLFEQTLTEASAMATYIGPAYDLIHDSGVLSSEQHETIGAGLLRPMLANIDRNKAGKSNWQTWHNAAMLWGGALVGDASWVEKAIADPANGFYRQMDVSVSQEGMWYENSWGYHFYTLRALVIMAEIARRLDIDLWSHERLKKMFTLPVHYTMGDGMLPRFGDDVNSSVKRVGGLFEPAYHAYRDPGMLSLLSDRPGFEGILLGRSDRPATQPPLESMAFEDAGHAILRTRGPAQLTAALTFGPYGGFHGHYDKLSFVFFGFGRELAVDPGRARSQAYRLPIHRNWYKATIAHNAVLVDGKSQNPAAGKLELFEQSDEYVTALASCDAAYAGVRHKRLLLMTDAYLLVLDTLRSDANHRFDWLYHNRAERIACDVATDTVNPADACAGGEYIRNARRGSTDEAVRVRFEGAEITTHVTLAAGKDTVVTTGDGVGAAVTDRVPMVLIGREGKEACFAAVLEPVRAGSRPRVAGVQLVPAAEAFIVTVDRDGQADQIEVRTGDQPTVTLSR
ncbi:MAG: alginate lyase family protein [Sedimentisphaerales bacterium]|nr:alginate lyase family protein [Sedimentisphaerales bacterium]